MAFSFWNGRRGSSGGGAGDDGGPARFAALAEVRAYWEGLRAKGGLPRREALDPRGIAGALHCTFMAERIGAGLARFRIAGMQLNDLMGSEVRGLPVSLLFTPAARSRLASGLERVFTLPAVADMILTAERGYGRPELDARLLLLPLIDTGGTTSLCLGCLAIKGEIGRSPRRFDVLRAMETVLDVAHQPPRSFSASLQPPTMKPGAPNAVELAENAPPYMPPPQRLGRPQLRLVKSDD
jgi:hypothetical protein